MPGGAEGGENEERPFNRDGVSVRKDKKPIFLNRFLNFSLIFSVIKYT